MKKLLALVKTLQGCASRYLEHSPYTAIDGTVWSEAAPEGFIADVIRLLDGPEQREAEREHLSDLSDEQILIQSLMRDLHVSDHIVTIREGDTTRVIVASALIS